MARAYQCDRCGGLFSAGHVSDFRISKYDVVRGSIEYDLCDDCSKELEEFLQTAPPTIGEDE